MLPKAPRSDVLENVLDLSIAQAIRRAGSQVPEVIHGLKLDIRVDLVRGSGEDVGVQWSFKADQEVSISNFETAGKFFSVFFFFLIGHGVI